MYVYVNIPVTWIPWDTIQYSTISVYLPTLSVGAISADLIDIITQLDLEYKRVGFPGTLKDMEPTP